MAKYTIDEETLVSLANSIRNKTNSTNLLTPLEMITEVIAISGNGNSNLGEEVIFDDRNNDVKNYLNASNVYSESNRATVSVIGNYANTNILDQDCPKSFLGKYNLSPKIVNNINGWQVNTIKSPPHMIKLEGGWNVRDCGGWNADNGTLKFGMLFRGARLENATTEDLNFLASEGIKLDLDLRDAGNASGQTRIPGASYYNAALTNAYSTMIQEEATTVTSACIKIMQSIIDGKPVYVHCASGADRTGSICGMLEAICGVSAIDIDRDYELTCFADVEQLTGRTRMGTWNSFWTTLDSGQGNQKMNVVKWLRDHGVTTNMLNSFREAMIDGNPSGVDIPTSHITNNLTNCSNSNTVSSIDSGSSYIATISPNSGYSMTILTVIMNGIDITSTAVNGNRINIENTIGNITITGFAEKITSYTNIIRQAEAADSTAIYNNGLGFKNGYYTSVGKESANAADCCTGFIYYPIIANGTQPTDILYIKGYTGNTNASHTRLSLWKTDKSFANEQNGFLSNSNIIFTIETLDTGYYKLTPKQNLTHMYSYNIGYIRFSFNQADGTNLIITRNEPIED